MPVYHRKPRCFLALIIALVLTWSGSGWAQSNNFWGAYRDYNGLVAQGKFNQALPYAEKVVELAYFEFGETHYIHAVALNNLGVVNDKLGRYAEGERLHKRALAIREKVRGPEHSEVAESLSNLSNPYFHQGRYAEAASVLQRV